MATSSPERNWWFPRYVRVSSGFDNWDYKRRWIRGKVICKTHQEDDVWPWFILGPLCLMLIFAGWPTHPVKVYYAVQSR